MENIPLRILLADDDEGDRLIFGEAMGELELNLKVQTVNNGMQLIEHLTKSTILPHLVFLDLNMPRKNGAECLNEIKANKKMNRFYRQKKLSIVLLGTISLCLFIISTDPRKLSASLLLVPPVLLFIILFTLGLSLLSAFTEVPKAKQRLMSGVLASAPVLLLSLASLGQLTGRIRSCRYYLLAA